MQIKLEKWDTKLPKEKWLDPQYCKEHRKKVMRFPQHDTVIASVADPHRKNADADPGKNFNADADPDADSCSY
jgi:hypothetical protein